MARLITPLKLNKLPLKEALEKIKGNEKIEGRSVLYKFVENNVLYLVDDKILAKIGLARFLRKEGIINRRSPLGMCVESDLPGVPWKSFSGKEAYKNNKELVKIQRIPKGNLPSRQWLKLGPLLEKGAEWKQEKLFGTKFIEEEEIEI